MKGATILNRACIHLRRGKEESLLRRHPWVFSGAIEHITEGIRPLAEGDIVDVRTKQGDFIAMVKETSIVGYISVQDLTMVSDIIHSRTMEAFFPLLVTAMIYLIIANMLTTVLDIIEIKIDPKHGKRTVKGVKMQ